MREGEGAVSHLLICGLYLNTTFKYFIIDEQQHRPAKVFRISVTIHSKSCINTPVCVCVWVCERERECVCEHGGFKTNSSVNYPFASCMC